jgi:hypothetical protein
VVVDSWYTSTELIEFVSSKGLPLVAEVKINRSILFTPPKTRQWRYLRGDEIMALIKQFYPHKLKAVWNKEIAACLYNIKSERFKKKLKN